MTSPSTSPIFVKQFLSLPQFQHFEALGEPNFGGMGVVQRAWDRTNSTEVGIKILLASLNQERFQREIEALKALSHPNIVEILDWGTVNECPYFIMTWHAGKSLDYFMSEAQTGEDLDEFWFRRFFWRLAEILDYCHDNGVIHRDLKPENILVDPRGEPILIDFGLVKLNEELVEESETGGLSLTKTGELLGTPAFMSPEQLNSKASFGESPEASDVWGFGATLYYALTGCPPFQTESLTELYVQILNGKPTDLYELNPMASPTLVNLTRKILVQDAKARPSFTEIMKQLDPKTFGKAGLPRWIMALGMVLIVVIGLAVLLLPMILKDPITIASLNKTPTMTKENTVVISGRLSEGPAELDINGEVIQVDQGGLFETSLSLREGSNRILLKVLESDAVDAFESIEIVCDQKNPGIALLLSQSPEGIFLCEDDFQLKGQLIDKHPFSVSLGTNNYTINKRGEFSIPLVGVDSVRELLLIGSDKAGNKVEKRLQVQEKRFYERALEQKRARDILEKAEQKARADRLNKKMPTIYEYPLVSDFNESLAKQREAYRELFKDPEDSQKIAPLLDFDYWQRAPRLKQDAAISWVAKRLGEEFQLLGSRTFQCGALQCYLGRFKHKKTGLILHLIPGGARVKRWFARPARGHNLQILSLLTSDKLFKSLLRYVLVSNAPGRGFRRGLIRDSKIKEKIDGFDELLAQYKEGLEAEGDKLEPDIFDDMVAYFFEDEFQFQWLKRYFKALYKSVSQNERFFFSGEYTAPFLMGQNEVSQGVFARFGAGEQILKEADLVYGHGDRYPIYNVNHNEVSEWLKKAGPGLRLPTELEWSHACHGGSKALYFWGDDGAKSKDYIWSAQIGQKPKVHDNSEHKDRTNSFGLIDMAGNVEEWCEDSFEAYIERIAELNANAPLQAFPAISKAAEFKEPVMGGSVAHHWLVCHPKFAKYDRDDSFRHSPGFRVACSIPIKRN